ncbi:SDR family NAD(P)-dependent oxidoreductase [Bremerella alba]|uniref:Dihydroanticapsin 7-dehydrogenase n=1 Tax=Bremerella alba TaxID=980252 RepID=A0A7V8V2M9_9BACT|nr:SDR family oxidoreductase [Bremerella alba]MBA2113823.1 Dihydroanticapsin 7-dehydrogenase [Bremerella alba]
MNDRPVAFITGASQGLGAATAAGFIGNGYDCFLVARNRQNLKAVASRVAIDGAQAAVCAGDLGDLSFAQEAVESCFEQFGRIDVLVNNAAWRNIGTMRQMELEEWEKTLRICLTAPAFLAKWCGEKMQAIGRGVILNVFSIQSKMAPVICPAYVAAKGGLDALTYELAALFGPSGIRVLGLNLGAIATEMSAHYVAENGDNLSQHLRQFAEDMIPLRRFAEPEEMARTMVMLADERANYMPGACLEIDGVWSHQATPCSLKHRQFPQEFSRRCIGNDSQPACRCR